MHIPLEHVQCVTCSSSVIILTSVLTTVLPISAPSTAVHSASRITTNSTLQLPHWFSHIIT